MPIAKLTPTPKGFLDLATPTGRLAKDPIALQAATFLNQDPVLNLDGDTTKLSYTELKASLANPAVSAEAKKALRRIEADFFDGVPAADQRKSYPTPSGARILTSSNNAKEVDAARALVASLAKTSPEFKALLKNLTIVISPHGKGLEAIPELGTVYAQAEGTSLIKDFPGAPGMTVAIRQDSLERWNMGLGHELLHQFVNASKPAQAEIEKVWKANYGPTPETDGYLTPEHMFVFAGQYYLAGFGPQLKAEAPEVFKLCEKYLGKASYSPRTTTPQEAAAGIKNIIDLYRK